MELRRRLPRSNHAFFGRFLRLQPVQEQALPLVLEGHDVLITAPTASGKTEAFAAPAAETVLAGERGGARVLVVSPTRALANDLKRRLEARFEALDIEFGRYTGEHKERVDGRMPEVAVTTPEGLDSLLARRPRALATVRLVVCDEIHVLDGTPRGDQLRVLLHRLERAADVRPQRVALSATVERPAECAARYLGEARLVCVGGARRIRAKAFDGRGSSDVAQHLDTLVRHGFRKVLVFCNSRNEVENLAAHLKGRCVFGDAVFLHHGSLSRTVRERTERRFLEAQAAVAFATMTLELGIDIGTVDFVLLAGPSPSVSSLLQRIGRGGRRSGSTRAGYVVKDQGERLVCRVLLAAGARGDLLGPPYAFRPGVLVQQALVLAGSHGWVDPARLAAAVPPPVWDEVAPLGPHELLTHMAEEGVLEQPISGRYVLAEPTERRYEGGFLHSNIDDGVSEDVVDRLTGDVIGQVAPSAGRRMNLGGTGRKVVARREGRILTDAVGGVATTYFPPRMRPCCSFAQARAVVAELGVAPDEIRQIPFATKTLVLHGLGTVGGLLFGYLLGERENSRTVEGVSPYVALLTRPLETLPACPLESARTFIRVQEERIGRVLSMGPWHRAMLQDTRARAVERAAGVEHLCSFLGSARLTRADQPEIRVQEVAARL